MTRFALVVALGCLAASALLADEILIGRIPYQDVKITSVDGNVVTFDSGGKSVKKPLDEVSRIMLDDDAAFSSAELLFCRRQYDQAIEAYQKLLPGSKVAWKVALINRRVALAKEFKANPPTDIPVSASQPGKRCLGCNGTGWAPCKDCRVGDINTGKLRCPDCNGRGRRTCPGCNGKWKEPCGACNGTGKEVVGHTQLGVGVYQQTAPCGACNGKGYTNVCHGYSDKNGFHRRCSEGSVPCEKCDGKGNLGVCPTCQGKKRLPCTECPEGRKLAGGPDKPSGNQPAAKDPATPEYVADQFIATAKPELTALQADLALKEWNTANAGKPVIWTATVDEVTSNGSGITLQATCASGIVIQATFPASAASELARVVKGQSVTISGKICACNRTGQGAREYKAIRFDLEGLAVAQKT